MTLKVHFLNVGHGDCTLIEHASGRLTMIDVNNSKSLPEESLASLAAHHGLSVEQFRYGRVSEKYSFSWADYYESLLVDPADFLAEKYPGQLVFRYVQTHPDMDHLSGLHRIFIQEGIQLLNFWDTDHSKTFVESDFAGTRYSWDDWVSYTSLRSGAHGAKVLNLLQDSAAQYYSDDRLELLSPTTALLESADSAENWNRSSYVLKLGYAGRSLIFPGDAEQTTWNAIEEVYDKDDLTCDVLKAAHHGRESGYSESATEKMDPAIVICSVGKKPDTDASDEYAAHGARVYSTRYQGTVTVTIEANGSMTVNNHSGEVIDSLPPLI